MLYLTSRVCLPSVGRSFPRPPPALPRRKKMGPLLRPGPGPFACQLASRTARRRTDQTTYHTQGRST